LYSVEKKNTPTLQKNLLSPFSADVKRCKYFQNVKEMYPFDKE
jgi:hypothetical protein